jgi:hypothetical protein
MFRARKARAIAGPFSPSPCSSLPALAIDDLDPVAGEEMEDQPAQSGQAIALDPGIEPGQPRFPETQARRGTERQIHGGSPAIGTNIKPK